MHLKQQGIALYTLVYRELIRMFRISSQVFLPPVITTLLYFLIFGSIIGKRIGLIEGVSYATFIAPGLVMMAVITNAYANVSTSLFSLRFQRSIEEILVSPMHDLFLLLGFMISGTLRGVIVAVLVYCISCFFLDIPYSNIPMTLFVVILVGALFSLAGFINGMLARTFDDVALIPTFVLGPLTYLGGVFYSTNMLPSFWKTVSHFNPIFYMVNVMRHAMIGQEEVNFALGLSVILAALVILIVFCLFLIKRGVGFRG